MKQRADAALELEGHHALLLPLREEHLDALVRIVRSDPERFRYTYVPQLPTSDDPYVVRTFADRDAGRALPFAIVEKTSGRIVGTTRFSEIALDDRRVEVGYTLLDPSVHRGPVNVDCKIVMFGHAFERWGVRRVQVQADERNRYSLGAIRALGLEYEGTLRAYGVAPDGGPRNAAMFSLLAEDWPAVRERLMRRRQNKALALGAEEG